MLALKHIGGSVAQQAKGISHQFHSFPFVTMTGTTDTRCRVIQLWFVCLKDAFVSSQVTTRLSRSMFLMATMVSGIGILINRCFGITGGGVLVDLAYDR